MLDYKYFRHARLQKEAHPEVAKRETEVSEEEATEKLRQAGKLAAEIRDKVAERVKPGVKVLDLCLEADKLIEETGFRPSFPINIAINNVAAHFSAPMDDTSVIQRGDVVKVDLGLHIDGFISDTAVTVDVGNKNPDLLKASKEATETAIDLIRPGTKTDSLGAIIEDIIRGYGFAPISELSGHQVKRWVVHGEKSIPNVANRGGDIMEENEVFALETFASTGEGSVHADINRVNIFRAVPFRVPIRRPSSRKILNLAVKEFKGLPFSERWLYKYLKPHEVKIGLNEIRRVGGLIEYHVLTERKGDALISQHEHTLIVRSDGPEVTTKL